MFVGKNQLFFKYFGTQPRESQIEVFKRCYTDPFFNRVNTISKKYLEKNINAVFI